MFSIKTPAEIKILKEGGKILASILNEVVFRVKPGVSAKELDNLAYELVTKAGGRPSFLNYSPPGDTKKYPASLCVSINDEIVHGLPTADKILKDGDIVSLDLGLEYKKFFTDMAVTVGVGKISKEAERLIDATREALERGTGEMKAGGRLGDYGFVVKDFAQSAGFSVVKELVGHGVGYSPHEDPDIPNYGKKGKGLELKKGMVLALEPMLCEGREDVMLGKDGWVWKTKDGLLSAHFEYTIVVEKGGCKVLTKI